MATPGIRLDDRVTRVETSLEGLTNDVRNLAHDTRQSQREIHLQLEKLGGSLSQISRTNWPLVFSAAGLVVGVMAMILNAWIAPIARDLSNLDNDFTRMATTDGRQDTLMADVQTEVARARVERAWLRDMMNAQNFQNDRMLGILWLEATGKAMPETDLPDLGPPQR